MAKAFLDAALSGVMRLFPGPQGRGRQESVQVQRRLAPLRMTEFVWCVLACVLPCVLLLAAVSARAQNGPASPPAPGRADPAATPSLREAWVPADALGPVLKRYPRAVPLSRDQLLTLLRDAHAADPAAADAANPPPAPAVLRQARFDGWLVPGPEANPQVRVEAVLEVEALSDAWTDVPLGLPGIALGTAEIDAPAPPPAASGAPPPPVPSALGRASLRREGDRPEGFAKLQFQGRGVHRLNLGFVLPVTVGPAGNFIALPRVEGVGEFILHLPAGTRADSPGGCAVQPEGAGIAACVALGHGGSAPPPPPANAIRGFVDRAHFDAAQPPVVPGPERPDGPNVPGPERLNWRTPPPAPTAASAVLQDGRVVATVEESGVTIRQEIALRPALGRLPGETRIVLPAAAGAVRVEGAGLARWEVGADGLHVTLAPSGNEDGGAAAFTVAYGLPLVLDAAGTPARTDLPLLEAAGAHRVTGEFIVRRGPGAVVQRIEPGAVASPMEGDIPARPEEDAGAFVAGFTLADLPAGGGGDAPPTALRLEARRVRARFRVDADAQADFQLDGVHISRLLTFQVEEGAVFTARVRLPPGEALLTLGATGDDPTPDWRQQGDEVRLDWTAGLTAGMQTVLVLESRTELAPPKPGAPVAATFGAALVPGAEPLTGYVALTGAPGLRLVTTGGEDRLERRDGRTTPLTGDVAWFYRDDFRLALRVERRTAETEARFTGYALPLAGAAEIHAQMDYQFLYAGVESVKIRVPRASADAFFFTGAHIAERRLDGDVWTIRFQGEQSGHYALGVQATIPAPADPGDAQRFHFRLPTVVPLETARWSGAWAVEANTDTEIRFVTTGVNEVDALHAPPLAGYQPRRRVIGAFEFLGGGTDAAIDLDGVRHPGAAVAAAVVDRLDLETAVSTSGVARHRATVRARLAGDGFFDLRLPPGAALWSLTLDGAPVKPVGGAGAPDVVRVELPGGRPPADASTVVAVYETPGPPWKGAGWQAVAAPGFDAGVPVLLSRWTLRLPDGFDYQLPASLAGAGLPAATPGDLLLPRIATALGHAAQWVFYFPQYWAARYDAMRGYGIGELRAAHASLPVWLAERAKRYPFRPIIQTMQAADDASAFSAAATGRDEQSVGQIDVVRRQSMATDPTENLRRGDADMIREDYEQAMHEYRLAVDALPDTPGTRERRTGAMQKFSDAAMKLAEQRITEGRYVDAETTVKVILRPEYNPNCQPAVNLLAQLQDPEYYHKTSGPQFIARVQQVRDLLKDAQGFFDAGRYDLAFKRYEQVLSLDPYNDAARKGEERVDLARTKHAEGAPYPATRGHLVWDVARGWELPGHATDRLPEAELLAAMNRKLARIIVPHVEFRSTTLADAVEYLRQESARLDVDSPPTERGINIFLRLPVGSSSRPAIAPPPTAESAIPGLPPGADVGTSALAAAPATAANTRISLTLTNIPLLEALRYVAQQANLKVKVEPYAVSLLPYTENTDIFVTREFRVPPNFFGPSAAQAANNHPDAETYLKSSGVQFPAGARATYLSGLGKLIVRNTQENIDLVEALFREAGAPPAPKSQQPLVLTDTQKITAKLLRIIIPHVEFRSTKLPDAIEFLRQECARLDREEPPDERGVNIFLKLPAATSAANSRDTKISLTLENIPALEALRYVAQQANLKVKVEQYAVSLVPLSENTDAMITQEIPVPADFVGNVFNTVAPFVGSVLDQGATSATTTGGNTTAAAGTNANGQIVRQDAESFLKSGGVQFPPGASATFLPSTGKLIIRNTQENIDLLMATVAAQSAQGRARPLAPLLDQRESAAGVAGLLPLRLDLPRNGVPYEFAGGGAPGTLAFRYAGWAAAARWRWVCLTLGALGFLLPAAGGARPWRRTFYAILALTFFPLIAAPSATVSCNALLAGWLWAVAGWSLGRWLLRRRRLVPVLLLCGAALLPARLHARPKPHPSPTPDPGPTPELVIVPYDASKPAAAQEPAQYYLPYERFLLLWDAAKRHRQGPAPTPPPGGQRHALSAARYDARLDGDTLAIDAVLDLQTFGEGWVGVPLGFEPRGVEAVTLDGAPAALGADGALWVGTPGAHRVGVTLRLPAGTVTAGTRLAWAVPPTTATLVTLTLPRADLWAEIRGGGPGGGEVEEATPGGRRLTASLGGAAGVELVFHDAPAPAPAAGDPSLGQITARLTATARQESVRAEIRLSIPPGSTQDHFTVELDPSLTLTGLDAPGIRQWRLATGGDRQTLEIALDAPVRGGYQLVLTADRPLGVLPAVRRTFPLVSVRAARVEETAALLTEGAVEFTLPDGPPAGLRRVDDHARDEGKLFAAYAGDGSAALVYSVRAAAERRTAHIDYLYQVGRGKIELAASVRLEPAADGAPLPTADLRLPPGFAVQAVAGGAVAQWWREGDVLSLRFGPAAGRREVPLLVYLVRQFDRAPERFALQPLVAAGCTETDGQTVVAADRSLRVGLTLRAGAPARDLSEIPPAGAAAEFQVRAPLERQRAFRYRGTAFDVGVTLENQPARWQAQWVTRATVREGGVALETHVSAQVRQGALDALAFSLPPGLAEARVSGADVRETVVTNLGQERRAYRVLFQNPLSADGETAFTISLELPLGADGRAALPDLTLPGDDGRPAGGFVLVENASSGEMGLDARGLDPAIEKDVPFLPAEIVAGTRFFRAAPAAPWSLGLRVTGLEKTAGREALVAYAELTTTLRADGEEWHRAVYRLQNRRLQFLPVALPAGMEFIGARVAGESVRVDAGPAGKDGPPSLLVPLLKTRPGESSYDVELVYRRPAPGPAGGRRQPFFEHWEMRDPRLPGLPVEKTLWNVYLPPEARVLDIGGNLEPVVAALTATEKLESSLSDLRGLSATYLSTRASQEERQRALDNYQALAAAVTKEAMAESARRPAGPLDREAAIARPKVASQNAEVKRKQQSILSTVNSLNLSNTAAGQLPTESFAVDGADIRKNGEFDGFIRYGNPINPLASFGNAVSVQENQWRDNRADATKKAAASNSDGTGAAAPAGKARLALNDSVTVDLAEKDTLVSRDSFQAPLDAGPAGETARRLSTARAKTRAEPAAYAFQPAQRPPAAPGSPGSFAGTVLDAAAAPAQPAAVPAAPAGANNAPESLRSEGRISLAVDFPLEGEVYHFKKIKNDARLTLWSVQPWRFVRLGWLGVLLAILAAAWALRPGWRRVKRA